MRAVLTLRPRPALLPQVISSLNKMASLLREQAPAGSSSEMLRDLAVYLTLEKAQVGRLAGAGTAGLGSSRTSGGLPRCSTVPRQLSPCMSPRLPCSAYMGSNQPALASAARKRLRLPLCSTRTTQTWAGGGRRTRGCKQGPVRAARPASPPFSTLITRCCPPCLQDNGVLDCEEFRRLWCTAAAVSCARAGACSTCAPPALLTPHSPAHAPARPPSPLPPAPRFCLRSAKFAPELNDAEVQAALDMLDVNKDGNIQLAEFAAWYKSAGKKAAA